ncbi:MAG: Smr/MutS family protein [Planctomycetota bacterium]|nr:Smr/MutS family protein [Planctomycetota bacterium]
MGSRIRTLNIKSDRPSVDEARQRLKQAIVDARRDKVAVLKLIHGYGSSGVGGAIRDAIRSSLRRRVKEGLVAEFIPGESWSIFDPAARRLLELCQELGKDSDLDRHNEGITVILIDSQAGSGPDRGEVE